MLLLGQILYAQNLVLNNSFEFFYNLNELNKKQLENFQKFQVGYFKYCPKDITNCPLYGIGTILLCKSWSSCNNQISNDSPDLFNKCSIQFGVPISYMVIPKTIVASSYQKARNGNGYIGLVVLKQNINNIPFEGNEFIQAKLIHSLQQGKNYTVEFFANRADYSTVSTDCLGLYFSNKEIKVQDGKQMFKYKPQVSNPKGKVIEDTINWVKISDTYIAKGGEQYIVIGDFYPDKENTIKRDKKNTKDFICYYFIDDVSVTPIDDNPKNEPKVQSIALKDSPKDSLNLKNVVVGVPVVLSNIYFESGKSNLLPTSFAELNRLLEFMKDNPLAEVEIAGYTDDVGTDSYNMQLSVARAKSVADYVIQKGIAKERISYKGYGKTKPVSNNKTDEGKSLNRRVELKFLRK